MADHHQTRTYFNVLPCLVGVASHSSTHSLQLRAVSLSMLLCKLEREGEREREGGREGENER